MIIMRETPIYAAEDVAFGLYKTGTEQLSTESVNRVKPYVVNVQLGRAQINCKMEVDTGESRSTVSKHVYDAEFIRLSRSTCGSNFTQLFRGKDSRRGKNYYTSEI